MTKRIIGMLLSLLLATLLFCGCSAQTKNGSGTQTADVTEAVTEVTAEDGVTLSNDASDFVLLSEAVLRHGFKPLVEEWWHFTLENEPYPDTYFTFPINSDSLQ